jgi:hypothetical protein
MDPERTPGEQPSSPGTGNLLRSLRAAFAECRACMCLLHARNGRDVKPSYGECVRALVWFHVPDNFVPAEKSHKLAQCPLCSRLRKCQRAFNGLLHIRML